MMTDGITNTKDHSVSKTKCCNFSLCTKTLLGMVNNHPFIKFSQNCSLHGSKTTVKINVSKSSKVLHTDSVLFLHVRYLTGIKVQTLGSSLNCLAQKRSQMEQQLSRALVSMPDCKERRSYWKKSPDIQFYWLWLRSNAFILTGSHWSTQIFLPVTQKQRTMNNSETEKQI